MKRCTQCGEEKSPALFSRSNVGLDGLHTWCRSCKAKRSREWHSKNRERLNREDREQHARNPEIRRAQGKKYYRNNKTLCYLSRRKHKLSIYGLTPTDYERMAEKQEQRCAICKMLTYTGAQELAVDHCHKTFVVRGLLCRRCNLGLGHFEDNPELLAAAIHYLKESDERNRKSA